MWFVFTDIEGSTRLWREHGRAMGLCLARHDTIVRTVLAEHGGRLVKHTGDGVFAVFDDSRALTFALDVQRRLSREDWGDLDALRVKVAVAAGEAEVREGDYFGPIVNRASRLVEAAWGGQVVATEAAVKEADPLLGVELRDLGVHVFHDAGGPERIYQLLASDMTIRDFPPLKSLGTRPSNLPSELTPFIGRESELHDLKALISRPTCRLLTLWGAGGVGKTRLALRLAEEVAERYGWGACFVPLASLSAADVLVGAIGNALRLSYSSGRSPAQQLLDYLQDKSMLLVLDNFEHLLPEGAELVGEILAAAPNVTVVVTSRQRLRLYGEVLYEVQGMAFPPSATAEGFEDYGAVRLLVDAIRRVVHSFELREHERATVVKICELTGGFPLAIELAASWAPALSLDALARCLERGMAEPAETVANLPERHRNMRAVFDYSYSLLDDEEKRLLERLSVFRGGCTLDAAEQVAGATARTLGRLVDKSLVRRSPDGRYGLHEFIRVNAGERMAHRGEECEDLARRHMRFYLGFLDSRAAALRGPETKKALEEVLPEIDNVRAAWDTAIRIRDTEALRVSASALGVYYSVTGLFDEAERRFAQAEAAIREIDDGSGRYDRVLGALMAWRGGALAAMSRATQAEGVLRESVRRALRTGDRLCVSDALLSLGAAASDRGNFRRAALLSSGSLRISRAIGYRVGVAKALEKLGVDLRRMGEYDRARGVLAQAVDSARECGDTRLSIVALMSLAAVEAERGDLAEGRALLEEARALATSIGDTRLLSNVLGNLGRTLMLSGAYEEARAMLLEALRFKDEASDLACTVIGCANLACVANLMARHEEAARFAELGIESAQKRGLDFGLSHCLSQLAWAKLCLGKHEECRRILAEATRQAIHGRVGPRMAEALVVFAMLRAAQGDAAKAVEIVAAIRRNPPTRFTGELAGRLLTEWSKRLEPDLASASLRRGEAEDWRAFLQGVIPELGT